MTMTWSDAVNGSTQKPTRPARPSYIPHHLRNVGGVSAYHNANSFGFSTSESTQYGFRSNRFVDRENHGRSGPRRGGGGGGRGRGRGYVRRARHDKQWNSYPNSSQNPSLINQDPFDICDRFDELDVGEEDANDVGGGINFDAYDDIPVEATGSEIPPPVDTFLEIDLGDRVNNNIKRCKYVKPTPIQRHAIPIAMAGRDLMACAQTGSGKTAAFCFPIISGVLKNRCATSQPQFCFSRTVFPSALILSPTRELASQIYEEAKKFAFQTGVKIAVAYGGASITLQLRNLERGVDILVATPGRLVDMIDRARVSLRMIRHLVVDEADRMLDMGFEPQIRKIVEQLDMPQPGSRQTMLFSATFPNDIQRLASDFLSNYIFVAVGRVGSSTSLIVQKVDYVLDMDKRSHLMKILHTQTANGSCGKLVQLALTLVFVETKKGADALECWLSMNGFPAIAIHGDKVQMERERALKSFKSGVTPILVATDVASRGLDIPHVAHVINFDLPKDIDDYVHRIGRTGRAGKSGLATAFFSDKNLPLAKSLAELMREANQEVPVWLNQYAERSISSRGQRFVGNKFGGYDFRSASYRHSSIYGDVADYHLDGSSCGVSDVPGSSESYSANVSAEAYVPGPCGYEENYAGVVAGGCE
ncbi:DEAD-box ATP-dependent RNA helicase 52C isoform X1 [Ziziphus jujuba]|uniref:RNA helicase n=1 Tax=Ziziphus jujuba TaxID=326968 RepID=A0ABM3ZXB2_ZIZJJ|nr:DEAD-box ATP-dependent RNA helicase 52C isoform X1 [Ziziphus jujuba]